MRWEVRPWSRRRRAAMRRGVDRRTHLDDAGQDALHGERGVDDVRRVLAVREDARAAADDVVRVADDLHLVQVVVLQDLVESRVDVIEPLTRR